MAENPHAPKDVLIMLALDNEPEVRLAVSENKGTTPYALGLLVKDDHVDVRYGVAENHQMPDEILLFLSMDDNPYVRCRAIKTLKGFLVSRKHGSRNFGRHNIVMHCRGGFFHTLRFARLFAELRSRYITSASI